jgi:hypothetical protein
VRGSIEPRKWIVFHRKVGRGYRILFYIAVIVLFRFWARDTQLRSVLCRPRNFERTQTNAWSGRARLEATGSARFSYRSQRLGIRPLHRPAAARDQRSRLWTALIAAPNDAGGNRVIRHVGIDASAASRKMKAVAFCSQRNTAASCIIQMLARRPPTGATIY